MTDPRRALPSVDRLLQEPRLRSRAADWSAAEVADAAREVLEAVRQGSRPAPADWAAAVAQAFDRRVSPSLRPVINATGVVLHTNLGRAPLALEAVAAAGAAAGYATVEYDLDSGLRGDRHAHCARALADLTGAEAAVVVNNAAGAILLAASALAAGREVLISRGELIEIGGSFRIPDVVAASGARLHEVGTTNRTHLRDYRSAIGSATALVLTVHRSNFEQRGFVASPEPAELAALAHHHRLPYVHDVGSGLLQDLSLWGLTGEPLVPRAVREGADLVLFSGDKLLGGPQAGCLVGRADRIAECRQHPLARALRPDKVTLAALEATLTLHRDPARARARIPILRMLTAPAAELRSRAEELGAAIASLPWPGDPPALQAGMSTPGGGSFPAAELATTVVVLDPGAAGPDALAARLRAGRTPVVARIQGDRVVLDPRTVAPSEVTALVEAVSAALTSAP